MNCPRCNQPVGDGAPFCTNCGQPLLVAPSVAEQMPTAALAQPGFIGAQISPPGASPALPNFAPIQPQAINPMVQAQAPPYPGYPSTPVAAQPYSPVQASTKPYDIFFGIGSIAVFVIGLLIGFAALAGAFLGVYAIRYARVRHSTLGTVLGTLGTVLNLAVFILIFILNATHS